MTPAARLAAASAVMDQVLSGDPAEKALTNWGRGARYAGSGDRAAVRDLVFDMLRRRRSCAALGGAETGRGLALGLLRARGQDPEALFTGGAHGLAPLDAQEAARGMTAADLPPDVALDCPDWLWPAMQAALGPRTDPVLRAMQDRAPVFLRANLARTDRKAAAAALAAEGVATRPHPLADTALEVTENARRLRQTRAFADGLVELQDASSQAVIAALPDPRGLRVLDFCAGGGGKTLALAARGAGQGGVLVAHDINAGRMQDLPARAARAGVAPRLVAPGAAATAGPYDLILVDAPCSGSGSWRRAPDGKWRLTLGALAQLCDTQAAILSETAAMLGPGGMLAYATCSVLRAENEDAVAAFLDRHPGWRCSAQIRFWPDAGGDGFFLALLTLGKEVFQSTLD